MSKDNDKTENKEQKKHWKLFGPGKMKPDIYSR